MFFNLILSLVLLRYEGTVWDDLAHGKGVYVAEEGLVRFVCSLSYKLHFLFYLSIQYYFVAGKTLQATKMLK